MKALLTKSCGIFLIMFLGSFSQAPQLIKERFQLGYYTGNSGKVEGYIYFTYDTYEKFNLKKDLTDKKCVKRVNECTGFFVDGKTFKVIENIDLKTGIWNITAEKAFAEVVTEGSMNHYKVYSMVGNANMNAPGAIGVTSYILEKNNSKLYVLAPTKKGKFKTEMAALFDDRAEILEKIKSGTYSLDNITELVADYNSKP